MKIDITDRFRAFSHSSGHEAMIPSTHFKVKAFPAALEVVDCLTGAKTTFLWDLKGPVLPFTIEQDLERPCVRIYGESKQGYFRFILKSEDGFIVLCMEKTPEKGISQLDTSGAVLHVFFRGEKKRVVASSNVSESGIREQLFLGNSKHKDWDFIRKRRDLTEILPFWYALGQMAPELPQEEGAMMNLLSQCEERVLLKDKSVDDLILNLYLAGLSGGLVPRAFDEEFQGILPCHSVASGSQQTILKRGAFLIRSLFFQEDNAVCSILPCLPSQFVCGKMLNINTRRGGCRIALEWTKHQMRRMTVSVEKEGVFHPVFPKEIKKYRLRMSSKDKGRILQNGESFSVNAGQELWMDRFQK